MSVGDVAVTYHTSLRAVAVALIAAAIVATLPVVHMAAQAPAAIKRGQDVFTERKCTVCHLVGEVGNKKGPVLDGIGAKLSADDIRLWITNAPDMAAKANITRKPPMRAYTDLSKEDLDGLVAYISSLKK
jgi:cytochrome c2